MSTSDLKALPGKLDIKRHLPSILYLSHLPLINANEDISSEARALKFGLILYLHPYFVYAIRKDLRADSCELPLVANVICAQISSTGPYCMLKNYMGHEEIKPVFLVPTKRGSNQTPQPQRLARKFKFLL